MKAKELICLLQKHTEPDVEIKILVDPDDGLGVLIEHSVDFARLEINARTGERDFVLVTHMDLNLSREGQLDPCPDGK